MTATRARVAAVGRRPAPAGASHRTGRLLGALIAVVMLVPIGVYLWIAAHRVGYPFELDWMEGGSVGLTARVAAGHSLYVAPSLHFVGWTYTPLYYWVTAALGKLVGVGFADLRAVSVAASLAAMGILAWIVVRDTGRVAAGVVAAGLFAATFRLSGAWLDTGRVDSLFVALALLVVALAPRARSARHGVGLGALAFAAFFTKQAALFAVAPMLLWLAVARPRAGLAAAATLAVAVVGSTLWLDAASNNWYRYYVFDELAGQSWAPGVWTQFWTRDLLAPEWPLLVLGGAALTTLARRRPCLASPAVGHLCAVAGLIAAAWVSRLHTGGYANVLIPAYAATALLGGLAAGRLLARGGTPAGLFAAGVLIVQLVVLAYPIGAQLPTSADRAAGRALLRTLRSLPPGPVLVLRHPWYATLVDRGSFAQGEAITDVLRSSAPRGARVLRASLPHALDVDHVQAVILDGSFDAPPLGPALHRDFRLVTRPIRPALYPLTDVRTAPTLLYLRVR